MAHTDLHHHLRRALDSLSQRGGALAVAFSGGVDSTALLHALAQLPRARGLRAIHIDHGLHTASAQWTAHCRQFAGQLDVPIQIERVSVERTAGGGLEDAARNARHHAFAELLAPEEVLA